MRITPAGRGISRGAAAGGLPQAVFAHLAPESAGLDVRPVRKLALQAAAGATDFGGLFLAMSFFLVLAAMSMSAMLMRLMAERRASQAAIMLAGGFTARSVARAVCCEGLLLAVAGTLLGVPLGVLYAMGIIHALTTW